MGGNAVRLLKDGCENYPSRLEAIRTAQHWIHFETYILHEDKIGKVFAEALCERARAGVEARSFGYPTIEDDKFGAEMQAMFERDLENSTEVVLRSRKRLALSEVPRVEGRSVERRRTPRIEEWRTRGRSTRRAAAAGAIRMGRPLGAAITKRREVGAADAYNLFWSSLIFLGLGLLALRYPRAIAMPLGVLAVWFAVAGLFQAWRLYVQDDVHGYVHETQKESAAKQGETRDRADAGTHRHA